MISDGNLSILSDYMSLFSQMFISAISMATGVTREEMSVDYLVLGPNNQDMKVSGKSMTMCGTTFKWLQRIALKISLVFLSDGSLILWRLRSLQQ